MAFKSRPPGFIAVEEKLANFIEEVRKDLETDALMQKRFGSL